MDIATMNAVFAGTRDPRERSGTADEPVHSFHGALAVALSGIAPPGAGGAEVAEDVGRPGTSAGPRAARARHAPDTNPPPARTAADEGNEEDATPDTLDHETLVPTGAQPALPIIGLLRLPEDVTEQPTPSTRRLGTARGDIGRPSLRTAAGSQPGADGIQSPNRSQRASRDGGQTAAIPPQDPRSASCGTGPRGKAAIAGAAPDTILEGGALERNQIARTASLPGHDAALPDAQQLRPPSLDVPSQGLHGSRRGTPSDAQPGGLAAAEPSVSGPARGSANEDAWAALEGGPRSNAEAAFERELGDARIGAVGDGAPVPPAPTGAPGRRAARSSRDVATGQVTQESSQGAGADPASWERQTRSQEPTPSGAPQATSLAATHLDTTERPLGPPTGGANARSLERAESSMPSRHSGDHHVGGAAAILAAPTAHVRVHIDGLGPVSVQASALDSRVDVNVRGSEETTAALATALPELRASLRDASVPIRDITLSTFPDPDGRERPGSQPREQPDRAPEAQARSRTGRHRRVRFVL